jgi:glycosyltransferase involved in cell wall biosynthesis
MARPPYRRAIASADVKAPFVSVVIPTAGRAALLADCLSGLVAQDYPGERHEILVVENGPRDGTEERVAAVATGRVDYHHCRRKDANTARNAGVAAASGELVCFVDDDALIPETWLSELVAGAQRHPAAECVGGPVRARLEGAPPRVCDRHAVAGIALREPPADTEVGEVWGGNMAIRASALARIGPFREGLSCQQEWEWQQRLLRAGGGIVLIPPAWLWHRRTAADLHTGRLVGEFFRRGWTKASLGFPVDLRWTAGRARRNLGHGVRERCTTGFTEAARDAGLISRRLLRL